MSPPCTLFSTLQNLNFGKMNKNKVTEKLHEAMGHMAFAVLLCIKQAREGRKFMLEHPVGASSWQTALVKRLFFEKGVGKVNFDFCRFDMKSKDEEGEGQVKKRTGIMSNSKALLEGLSQHNCLGGHRHVHLMGGKAAACQRYPEKFCKYVCETVMKEKEQEAEFKNITKVINQLLPADPHSEDELYNDFDFYDDVSGRALNKKLAIEGRKVEMSFFKRMGVYEKVPRWHASRDGCPVISTRWLDVNKGDKASPDYRARLVGRELKMDSRLDLFAATPPLESLRAMCSLCASNQDRKYRMMTIDVKRAYFYAKSRRPIYIEIPIEDFEAGDQHNVARLRLSLYGTRDAAQNWAREYTQFLQKNGFEIGKASPCNFAHASRDLALTVHGDDFTAVGPEEELRWFKSIMEKQYEVKTKLLGPEEGMEREVRVLNRTISWEADGIRYEPDQRHAEIIVQEMGLEGGNSVVTPILADEPDVKEQREKSAELSPQEASRYRAIVARLNYLALDRPDLQYAAKSACRHMAAPREHDWKTVKRVARYLIGCPRAVQNFVWQRMPTAVTTYVDSDWAGDRTTRKSTSGGAMCLGKHLVKSWSTSQKTIALSSGEAELYALVKGAAQSKGLMSLMLDFGRELTATVCSDASAAVSMVHRSGLGKVRHIEVQYLWVQSEVAEGRLAVRKVGTNYNPADLLTKPLSSETMQRHLTALGCKVDATRSKRAPTLS